MHGMLMSVVINGSVHLLSDVGEIMYKGSAYAFVRHL
jgi:hypothetical protein